MARWRVVVVIGVVRLTERIIAWIGGLCGPLARSVAITDLKATPASRSGDLAQADVSSTLGLCHLLLADALHGCQDGGVLESGFVGDEHWSGLRCGLPYCTG